jgi:anti-sigma regulatory factor (Ser/Thr protein kinase)
MHNSSVAGPVKQIAREIRLEPTARAAGEARKFVAATLVELGHSDLVENARLIASELVTNALFHAPDLPIRLIIWQTGAFLDLEVWDCSSQPPVFLDPDLLAEGGRGLHIVNELGIAAGYTTFDCGKAVWVLLGLTDSEYHKGRCRRIGRK